MIDLELKNRLWWSYLDQSQRELLAQSETLLEREEYAGEKVFHDYAFVVFPAAKAYEGFVKKFLLDLGIIKQEQYEGRYFRVGKSLNPALPKRLHNHDWVYDNLSDFCQGEDLPQKLWNTWKKSRNLIFHWFPNEKHAISLNEARNRIIMIVEAIDKAFLECKLKLIWDPKSYN